MAFSERSGYTYLQVDRPVTNRPVHFISKVAFLGARIFGTEPTAAITETGIDLEADGEGGLDELTRQLVVVRQSAVDVYPADNLRLVLLRRSVPVAMEHRYNFNHYASRFTAKAPRKARAAAALALGSTIASRIDRIAEDSGFDPANSLVRFDRLQEISGTGFGTELALAPQVGSLGSSMLRRQVRQSEVELAHLSNKPAYPGSSFSPVVPFMRIPEDATDRQFERFIGEIQDCLPLMVTLGRMTAHSRTMIGAGVA